MALPSDIVLPDAAGSPVNRTFQLAGAVKAATSYRIDSSTQLGAARSLMIGHQLIGSAKSPTGDRHLTQWVHRVIGTDGLPYDLVLNQTLVVPRSTITRANINDMLKFNYGFWNTSGYVDNMLINSL